LTIQNADTTYATAVRISSPNWNVSPFHANLFPACPNFCTTSRLERPSRTMKRGPDSDKSVPHHSETVVSHGLGDAEKRLKQTSNRMECAGTWKTESSCEPHTRLRVPWMSAWIVRNNDNTRNACLERVTSVKGRKTSIWSAVDSLDNTKSKRLNRRST